ncbi:MAG TPA: hypothetical protein VMU95_31750 [Trebonia sp.]|nr:hypothetical protein [Trebonia sp.]
MNIDQLLDAMADSDPNPDSVLGLVHRKRRAARNRAIAAASGGLAVIAAVLLVVVPGLGTGASSSRSTASSGALPRSEAGQAIAPAASGLSSGAGNGTNGPAGILGPQREPGACTRATLEELLAAARRSGASVIVGSATLTSGAAAEHAAGSSVAYYSVTLRSVHTIAGPAVAPGATAWISAASPGDHPGQVSPAGQLFAIVYPSAGSGLPGPVLRAAPVVGGQVILSSDGCLGATAFPGSSAHAIAQGPTSEGTEIPLATAEKLATGA